MNLPTPTPTSTDQPRPRRLLRVDTSIRTEGSTSRAVADAAVAAWCAASPRAAVTCRDLGLDPLPALWPQAAVARSLLPAARTPEHRASMELAEELIDELLAADALVVGMPLYNFGVPQQLKHWVDLIICHPRANDVNVPLLPDRPALLVASRGGGYAPGTPREGWDHATPWMVRILADVWGMDVTVVAAELTASAYNPEMAHLRDAAVAQRDAACRDAAAFGRTAAGQVGAAA